MRMHHVDCVAPSTVASPPFEVIVFDCDGVLFDSKEANVHFYSHILEKSGACVQVQPEQHEYIHMHPVRESLRYLLGEGPEFDRAWRYCQQLDFWAFNKHLRCEPGLVDFLELTKASYRTAMATNRTVSTREVLAYFQLDHFFDLIVSASDVRFPKPHPESMERILDAFDVSPEQVLYLGDSQVDEALAAATGVFFVAYKNARLNAQLHITHFRQLYPLLFPDNGNGKQQTERPRTGTPCNGDQ